LGALLRESQLIKTLLPAYNQRLRQRAGMVALSVAEEPSPPAYVSSAVIDATQLDDLYGPFSSRNKRARGCARSPPTRHFVGGCWASSVATAPASRGNSRSARVRASAWNRRKRTMRAREALAPHALKRWPYSGMIAVREVGITDERIDVHVFRDWCWLGTVHDEARCITCSTARPAANSISTSTACWSGGSRDWP